MKTKIEKQLEKRIAVLEGILINFLASNFHHIVGGRDNGQDAQCL